MVDGDSSKGTEDNTGEWEWQRQRERISGNLTAEELQQKVELVVWDSNGGHAYPADTIGELRRVLRISQLDFPDRLLRRHTDELAVIVGLYLRLENRLTSAQQASLMERKLLKPAKTLAEALDDFSLAPEFTRRWSDL